MAAPRKTAGLKNFADQLTAAFPDRRLPDGWIADENHTGTSDHHPDDTPGSKPGWDGDPDSIPDVRGIDVDIRLGPGAPPMLTVCRHLAALPHLARVVRYFIHDGLIWHVRNGFVAVKHTGDPHRGHLHVSFAWTEAADDNTTFDYQFGALPMALTPEDKAWISTEIKRLTSDVGEILNGLAAELAKTNDQSPLAKRLRAIAWQYNGGGIPVGMSTLGVLDETLRGVRALVAKLAAEEQETPAP